MEAVSFESLQVPMSLGKTEFCPTYESVKKIGYGADDESGWIVGDPQEKMVHPVLLSMYLWWPQGFFIQEPGAVGHFDMFKQRFGHLLNYPYLHGKTHARFFSAFKAGTRITAEVSISEKYERRGREFIVLLARFTGEQGADIAEYRHTVMTRSHAPIRGIGNKESA